MKATVRNVEEQERRWFYGGGLHTWLAHDRDTDNGFLMVVAEMEGGKVTPLHTHPADETFYLLEGSILLHVDGTERELRSGGVSIVPRGVPHAFMVTSDTARLLDLHTPGGGEEFYRLASELHVEGDAPPAVDFDRIRRAGEASGTMTVVGPPPFQMPVDVS